MFGRTIRLGSANGIAIRMHPTFLVVLVWAVYQWGFRAHGGLAGMVFGLFVLVAVFSCVLLHELAHALAALRYGVRVEDIILLPVGGVARVEYSPLSPRAETVIALAGPALNLALATVLLPFIFLIASTRQLSEPIALVALVDDISPAGFIVYLWVANILLAAFNLLPAFPMDGGRVLRAGLATRMDYNRATQIAASAGQAMALLFGLVGFFYNPFLIFIALFVWVGAAQEAGLVEMRTALQGVPVVRAMETFFRVLGPGDPLAQAVDETLSSPQQDFPVIEDGRIVGLLTRRDLLQGLAQHGATSPVADSMQREFATVDASELLETALQRLEGGSVRTIPVVRGGALVGLVTLDNVGEFVAFRASLERGTTARRALSPGGGGGPWPSGS